MPQLLMVNDGYHQSKKIRCARNPTALTRSRRAIATSPIRLNGANIAGEFGAYGARLQYLSFIN